MVNDNTRCGNTSCVAAEVQGETVKVTSTIEGNNGVVHFTQDEWSAFLEQVKAGKWDDTIRQNAAA